MLPFNNNFVMLSIFSVDDPIKKITVGLVGLALGASTTILCQTMLLHLG